MPKKPSTLNRNDLQFLRSTCSLKARLRSPIVTCKLYRKKKLSNRVIPFESTAEKVLIECSHHIISITGWKSLTHSLMRQYLSLTWERPPNCSTRPEAGQRELDASIIAYMCPEWLTDIARSEANKFTSVRKRSELFSVGLQSINEQMLIWSLFAYLFSCANCSTNLKLYGVFGGGIAR